MCILCFTHTENFKEFKSIRKYIDIPTAYADMPHELAVGKQPIEIVRSFYNVIQNTTFADGGHFAGTLQHFYYFFIKNF